MHLAAARPDTSRGAVLLDPAAWHEVVDAMLASPATTWTGRVPAEKATGRTWTPQCSTPNSTSSGSHRLTYRYVTVGVSACRRWCYWSESAHAAARWERQIALVRANVPSARRSDQLLAALTNG